MATDDTDTSDATPVSSTLSQDDMQNVLRTVAAEAGNQGPAGWAGVANVIKNRLAAGTYGNSASAVVQQPKQFSSWNGGTPAMPDADTLAKMTPVVQSVFGGSAPDNTNGATHFYANQGPNAIPAPSWAQGVTPTQIGQQAFLKAAGGGGVSPSTTASIPAPTTTPTAPTDMTGGNGAMNANFLTNGVGTLFGMTPQQSSGLGSRIERASAGLASISSPSQAAVIASLAPKIAASPWTDEGAAPSKQGRMQLNTQTGQYRYVPNPTGANDDSPDDMKAPDFKNLNTFETQTQSNRQLADDALAAQQMLVSNPNIYKSINGGTDTTNFIKNFMGKSDDVSAFGKLATSLIARSVEASAGAPGMGTASRSVYMQKLEKEAMAPSGAGMDPKLLYDVLGRIAQGAQQRYEGSISSLTSMKKRFKDNMAFSLDPSGDPSAYDKAVRKNWSTLQSTASDAYKNQFLPWHDNHVNGTAPATGLTRVQQIQQMYPHPGVPAAALPQPTAPSGPVGLPGGGAMPWQPGMPPPQT